MRTSTRSTERKKERARENEREIERERVICDLFNLFFFQYLKDLKEQNARIIIADMYQAAARAIMCEAYHQNMTAREVRNVT